MKQRRLLLTVVTMLTLSAFGGEQEDIVGRIKALYDAIAQRNEAGVNKFACHNWWETVAAVEKKDAGEAEIGFFNDDLWTQMQDSNPDHFEIQNVKFLQLDAEKGTALVDFILYSTVQTIHQKFAFCREDGDWRVHNIIRCYPSFDGTEEEVDMMKGMKEYLAQPQEQAPELVFTSRSTSLTARISISNTSHCGIVMIRCRSMKASGIMIFPWDTTCRCSSCYSRCQASHVTRMR